MSKNCFASQSCSRRPLAIKAWSRSAQASLEEQNEDSLEEMFTSLQPLTSLSHEINSCIPSEEEIADDASPGLKQVRRQMHQANDRIRAQLNAMVNGGTRNYLQDAVITQRNGRFCIPVKAEYRSQVPWRSTISPLPDPHSSSSRWLS